MSERPHVLQSTERRQSRDYGRGATGIFGNPVPGPARRFEIVAEPLQGGPSFGALGVDRSMHGVVNPHPGYENFTRDIVRKPLNQDMDEFGRPGLDMDCLSASAQGVGLQVNTEVGIRDGLPAGRAASRRGAVPDKTIGVFSHVASRGYPQGSLLHFLGRSTSFLGISFPIMVVYQNIETDHTMATEIVSISDPMPTAVSRRERRRPRKNPNLARARWIERSIREWPDTLKRYGWRAHHSLVALEQRNVDKSPGFMAALNRDLAAFDLAYSFHRWIGRHRLALPKPDAA